MKTATTGGLASASAGLRYGALGLPLAFVALPLYVVLPNHYAAQFGVPLAALGAVLLGARLLDAFADPLIGRWVDRLFARGALGVWWAAAIAALALALGFRALFFPCVSGSAALLWWCAIGLAFTYLAYSVMSVVHQAWGARLGGDEGGRARVVAWREGAALVGVLVASVLPSLAGLQVATLVFAGLLALGLWLLRGAPRPAVEPGPGGDAALWLPFEVSAFRRLLAIFVVNGIASAVPATLVLFFIRDRLQAPNWEPAFLAAYFAAGAASIPLWVRAVSRFGLAASWLAGMALAIVTFGWAATLGAGDTLGFLAVCIASGTALGADLALPGALLAGVIQRAGHGGRSEGAYFGWWNFATKLNLAIAAGLALPLLSAIGYESGARDADALRALTIGYCLLPCVLKLFAALLLWVLWLRPPTLEGR
ncbi:MFS transporter [uncultured Methylibium sp.]|uniref:MFS transporter n=1 Tax=uncultured Methylibium sp. TaxID=381093 RepID=UPI0025F83F25|nr:MFS transporter [uncultured Methylibium sp.]